MSDSYTSNLNLTKPEVGASRDSWGAKINSGLDAVDSVFNAGGNGTSVGLNVGSGKTLNVTGTVSGGVIATVSGSQTLTNKTISGSSNTITGLSLTSAVTGTLPVGNGGTGVTTVPASNQLLVGNGSGYSLATLQAGSNVAITNTNGVLTISATTSPSGITAVANGGTGISTVPTNGQILIGNGAGYSLNTLTAGTGITITNSSGGIQISSSVSSGGGTITGVSGASTVSGLTLTGGGTAGNVQLTLSGSVSVAGTALTGGQLATNITSSSLTSVGTLGSLSVSGLASVGSLSTSGSISGGGITGTSLSAGSGTITGGSITGSSLTVNGTSSHTGAATFSSSASFPGTTSISSTGSVLVGTTSTAPGYANSTIGGAWTTDASNGPGMFISRANYVNLVLNNNSAGSVVEFYKSGAGVGSIQVTSSSTSYGTSSDYRLKQNLEPLTGALSRLQSLNVYRFNWKADPNGPKVDGFVAHEVTPVVPEAISGEKDAVTADGKIKAQNIDQSKLVPLLVAALQEANNKIEALTSRVAALEAR